MYLRLLLLWVVLLLLLNHNPSSQLLSISTGDRTQVFICLYAVISLYCIQSDQYNFQNICCTVLSIDIPEEPPSLIHIEPIRHPERITPQHMVNPSDSEICRAIKTQSVGSQSASSSSPPTVWFSSRLSEMDAQLAALQNIADHLEMDFSNSRMVHKHSIFILLILLMTQVYKLSLNAGSNIYGSLCSWWTLLKSSHQSWLLMWSRPQQWRKPSDCLSHRKVWA